MDWKDKLTRLASTLLSQRNAPLLMKEAAWRAVTFVVKCGKSHPVSFALRPVLSHRRLKPVVGLNIALLSLVVAVWGPVPSLAGENTGGRVELAIHTEGDVNPSTAESLRSPLSSYRVSQGFWFFHPGIDMAASFGTPVYPVMAGRVAQVQKDRSGYGNHVVVSHGGDFETLYAHLSRVLVAVGQEVTGETQLGEVGSTGHSTGPHLHLEIRQNGQPINPRAVLPSLP